MSILNNSLLLGADAGAAGYQISRSLRFNSSDSAYCGRTFSSANTSNTTSTLSWWVKRARLGATDCMFSGYDGSSEYATYIQFDAGDTFTLTNPGYNVALTTSQVFRDTSAWYHFLLVWDTSNATSSERYRLFVNGTRVTAFSTAVYPSQNDTGRFIYANANNRIGTTWGSSGYSYFSGYLADIHFIDGQALTPSAFGQFDANNVWQPKAYSGPTPTGNSFWLPFSDNSAATATTLGKDGFNLGNNWTPNNLSVTAGAGNDSLVDSPTSYGTDTGAGGEVRGNYATLNPLNSGGATLANGNLESSSTSNQFPATTIGISAGIKTYWEVTLSSLGTGNTWIGIRSTQVNVLIKLQGTDTGQLFVQDVSGSNGGDSTTGGWAANSYAANDVLGIGLDVSASTFIFYKNGVIQNTYTNSKLNVGAAYFPTYYGDTGTATGIWNFGQRAYAYQSPGTNRPSSDYKALCDTNLPTPTIANGATAMDVKLYTGNGGTQTISGLGFSPDLVWIKKRNSGSNSNHLLADTVRGVSTFLSSSGPFAESTFDAAWRSNWGDLTAFNSDGFTVVAGSSSDDNINDSPNTHVAWTWDAGSSTVTNTQGSITSQVRANPSAGFSIVTWTGNGTAGATVGHGLGAKPFLRIIKRRDAASTIGWMTFHESAPSSYFTLNSTNAATPASEAAPTSSVFSLPADANSNASGGTYVAYCFAPVAGYSAFGSYTGNGSADGPFVYTGHRVRWLLVKNATNGGSWVLHDTTRSTYNVSGQELLPDSSGAEYTFTRFDFLSNGFKGRSTNNASNTNGDTYIYAAFAENPFQYARAR